MSAYDNGLKCEDFSFYTIYKDTKTTVGTQLLRCTWMFMRIDSFRCIFCWIVRKH